MKVKDLIKALQEADPTGNCEVVINKGRWWHAREVHTVPIIKGVDKVKGAYGGPALVQTSESGYVLTEEDDKVIIDTLTLSDIMHQNPGIRVWAFARDSAAEMYIAEEVQKLRDKCTAHRTHTSYITKKIQEQLGNKNE